VEPGTYNTEIYRNAVKRMGSQYTVRLLGDRVPNNEPLIARKNGRHMVKGCCTRTAVAALIAP